MVSRLEDRNNWCKNVKSLLDVYGFSYVWLNPNNVDLKTFHITFRNRVLDVFKQSWFESVNTSSTLFMYKYVKEHLMLEPYLDLLPKQLRNAMSRLRLSSHKLRVETGRYGQNRIVRAERYCTMCNNTDIEDEFHLFIVCPVYRNLRNEYIKPYYVRNPSMYKFIDLLKTTNRKLLKNLCTFITEAFKLRNSIINRN